jgi:hypothetical protein
MSVFLMSKRKKVKKKNSKVEIWTEEQIDEMQKAILLKTSTISAVTLIE